MQDRFDSGLQRMSEVGRYQVSEEDTDPRGWTVVTRDGLRVGEVKDLIVDTAAMKVRYFEVEADGARGGHSRVLVDAFEADLLDREKRVVIDSDVASLPPASGVGRYEAALADDRGALTGAPSYDRNAERMTRSEEELRIGKREVEAGEVVVNKSVETEHVSTPVERRVERVRVERRPVTGATASMEASIQDGEIRIPIVEEEVVVEKRPVVKEEILLTRDVESETEVVESELRKERVDVHEEGRTGRVRSPDKGGPRGGH